MEELLRACVDEMYGLDKGDHITDPDEVVFQLKNVYVTRKQIKHVIEQRKAEGRSLEEVREVVGNIPKTISNFDFEMVNSNQKYAGSVLQIKVFNKWERGMVVVLDKEMYGRKSLITAYPYRLVSSYFLLLKKLHTSAAGKTPHP